MPTMPPATAALRGAVRGMLRDRMQAGAISTGQLVLVACSGGADSLALAAATAFVAPRIGLRAGAVNVDHGMQPGSARVSHTAIDQCHALGLEPAFVVRPTGPPPSGLGPEAAAREVRYPALARAAERTGAVAVLLGHTLDDQAETVLLALARGSGTRAVAGMDPVRGRYLRPLLNVRRAQTVAACAEAGVHPWDDPANTADGPWRTATGAPLPRAGLRERVLPALIDVLGPGVIDALGRTANLARADADLLEELARGAYERARVDADHVVGPTSEDGTAERGDSTTTARGDSSAAERRDSTTQTDGPGPDDGAQQAGAGPDDGAQQNGAVPDDGAQHRLPGRGYGGDLPAQPVPPAVVLDVGTLLAEPAALRTRVLRAATIEAGSPPGAVGAVHVNAMDALVTAWRGQGPLHLPGGVRVGRRYGNLVFDPPAG